MFICIRILLKFLPYTFRKVIEQTSFNKYFIDRRYEIKIVFYFNFNFIQYLISILSSGNRRTCFNETKNEYQSQISFSFMFLLGRSDPARSRLSKREIKKDFIFI